VNVVLIAAVAVLLVVVAWLLAYKVKHPHTKEDLVKARKDSITRSRSVVSGKVQEHLAPLFPEFISQFNPKDARFLGSPLDFVVFDGLDDGEVQRVVFVEIKTGKAGLVSRERLCRNAIEAGRVEYQLLRLEDASSGVVLEEPVLE
jgi:predicted Holliday junction resolvase-like endonuclease